MGLIYASMKLNYSEGSGRLKWWAVGKTGSSARPGDFFPLRPIRRSRESTGKFPDLCSGGEGRVLCDALPLSRDRPLRVCIVVRCGSARECAESVAMHWRSRTWKEELSTFQKLIGQFHCLYFHCNKIMVSFFLNNPALYYKKKRYKVRLQHFLIW